MLDEHCIGRSAYYKHLAKFKHSDLGVLLKDKKYRPRSPLMCEKCIHNIGTPGYLEASRYLAKEYPQYKLQTCDLDKTGIRICQNIAAVGRYVRNMNDSEKGFSKIIYKKRIPRQMAGDS